uniref:C-type lectin domain-containing protein n=1 Tax=Panagrolaimus sp. PS1159 TaxID=55785 RepID=A0AC35GT92_9BILA
MFIQLFVLFYSALFVLSSNTCPSESFSWQNYCLFFNSTALDFSSAQFSCREIQGNLVSIHDAFYNAILTENALKQFQQINNNSTDFWIGAKTVGWDDVWIWVDGTNLNYSDWRNGEPNTGMEKGAALSWIDGYWSAHNIYDSKPFVCELSKQLFAAAAITTSIKEPEEI